VALSTKWYPIHSNSLLLLLATKPATVLAEVLEQLTCRLSAFSMRTSHSRFKEFVEWEAYWPHSLSLPSTSLLNRQMGTLNVMVHWRPSGPKTSVIRPPSKWASRTPLSRTRRTLWNAMAFCPLVPFDSNFGWIPRGRHDHDLFRMF